MEADGVTSAEQPAQQTEPMDQGAPQLQRSHSQSLISRFFAIDSSGSNESCGTYITCKMSQMEEAVANHFTEITEMVQRESNVESIELTPCIQQYEYGQLQGDSHPEVVFRDPPVTDRENPEPEQPDSTP